MAKAERIEPSMTLCPKYRAALTAVGLAISVAMSVATPAELFAQATPQGSPTTADPPAVAAPQVTPAPSSPAPAVEQSMTPSPDVVLKLPRDLSPWGMFLNADIIVKLVMIGLVFASLVTYGVPFIGILWGILDGEKITIKQVACLAVILFGVYLSNLPDKKESKTAVLLSEELINEA